MAAKITTLIPSQNYETIRDLIGIILAEELTNQNTLNANSLLLADIYIERSRIFDKTELPAINISMNSISYDTKFRTESKGNVKYYIEIQTNRVDTDTRAGDEQSAVDVEYLAGKVRAILMHPVYTNLLNRSIVASTNISSIQIGKIQQNDLLNNTVARLEFDVIMIEKNGEFIPTQIEGIDSNFKIKNTNKGYYIVTEN